MVDVENFKTLLLPDETIVWSDRPRQGIMFVPRDALLIPFSLLWGGFAIFWESSVLSAKAPASFKLFGVPFVLVGLFMIVGRFFLDAWLRSNTAYALTERRVLILRWGPWSSFKAIRLDRLPEATLNEGTNGRGTIRFGEQGSLWGGRSGSAGSWIASLDPTPQLLSIPDVRKVFALIQQNTQRA